MADEAISAATENPLMSGFEGVERTTSLATPPQPSVTDPGKAAPGAIPTVLPDSTKGTGVEAGSPEGYDDAVTFLRDEGIPESFIASADKEELITYAAAQAQNEEKAETEGTSEVTKLLEQVAERLATDEAGTAEKATAEAAQPKASGNEEVALLRSQVDLLVKLYERDKIDSWVQRSKGEFPAIADAGVQDKITKLASALMQVGHEKDINLALDRATKIVVEEVGSGETALSRRAMVAKLRLNSPTPPREANKTKMVADMTSDEVRDKQLAFVLDGKSDEGFELAKEFNAKNRTAFKNII